MRLMHLAVLAWVVICLIGLFAYSQSTLIDFDDERLYRAAQDADFDTEFAQFAESKLQHALKSTVIHFSSQDGCLCEYVAQKHIQAVTALANEMGKHNVSISLHDNQLWQPFIPATPAIAVFDENGVLSYLGPYATGSGCFTGDGIVEKHLDSVSLIGATIPLDAKGCYCRT